MRAYVAKPSFPCVGARSAFNKDRARFGSYRTLGDDAGVPALCADLLHFSREFPEPGVDPVTFCAMFDDDVRSEAQFSRRMWDQLQSMHEYDSATFDWDPAVSSDPSQADFSFSIAGRAFFVVGLSPVASRLSRRAPLPCLVFNFHDQFELLRETGKYGGMQKVIRRRELELQGSINPVLARFGDASEARQYSGEAVDAGWTCPFHAMRETSDA